MAEVLKSVGEALSKLGLRAPWRVSCSLAVFSLALSPALTPSCSLVFIQFTGPASSPEYMSHLPRAGEYRVKAPS